MRPNVAIVSSRPETIGDDYSRLMKLAGLDGTVNSDNTILAVEARRPDWSHGQVSPPWQVEALLKYLSNKTTDGTAAPLILALKDSGLSSSLAGKGWDELLTKFEHRTFTEDLLQPAPFRPEALLPALEGVLPKGFRLSPQLRGKDLLISSTLSMALGGLLGANVAFLDSLLGAGRKAGGKIPEGEVLAEVVALAHDVFNSITVVTDITVVSIVRRGGARVPLVRNLLVAGNDPLAVDAVLIHLTGCKPADYPWLQLCQDRGTGVADLGGIKMVGETEWLDLDFQIPEDTFASGNLGAQLSPGNLLNRMAGRQGSSKLPVESAWDRLYRTYVSGVTS